MVPTFLYSINSEGDTWGESKGMADQDGPVYSWPHTKLFLCPQGTSLGIGTNPQRGGTCRQEVSKGTDSLATSLVWEQMVSGYTGPLST